MCEREDPDEENAVGLTVHDENVNIGNVNSAPSRPDEESLTEGNVQASGSITPHNFFSQSSESITPHSFFSQSTPHIFFSQSVGSYVVPVPLRFFAPSSVTSLPSVSDGSWYPSPPLYSPFHPYRFPDASIGVTLRLRDPGSSFRPLSMMQSGISVRPETPSTPLGYAMSAAGQKKSSKKAPRLSTALERMSLGMLQPSGQGLRKTGKTEGSAMLLTAAKAAAAENDEESPAAASILLQESSQDDAAISRQLTRSTATTVDLSSVQEDKGDLGSRGLFPPEGYAAATPRNWQRDSEELKLLNQSELHCSPSAGSLSSAQFDCASSNAFGSNLPNPGASAQQNAAAVKEAAPPDTGQSAVDDEDLIIWRSCKICWDRRWRFVFIPCGHGSCKHCYVRLENTTCPFCRKCIRKIVEVRLCARLGQ